MQAHTRTHATTATAWRHKHARTHGAGASRRPLKTLCTLLQDWTGHRPIICAWELGIQLACTWSQHLLSLSGHSPEPPKGAEHAMLCYAPAPTQHHHHHQRHPQISSTDGLPTAKQRRDKIHYACAKASTLSNVPNICQSRSLTWTPPNTQSKTQHQSSASTASWALLLCAASKPPCLSNTGSATT
jgi:hypothetical protein